MAQGLDLMLNILERILGLAFCTNVTILFSHILAALDAYAFFGLFFLLIGQLRFIYGGRFPALALGL